MSESIRFSSIDPTEDRAYAEQAAKLWHTEVMGGHPDDWQYAFEDCFEERPIWAIGAFDPKACCWQLPASPMT